MLRRYSRLQTSQVQTSRRCSTPRAQATKASPSAGAVRPPGWEQAAGAYAEAGSFRSVADVVDAESLDRVRAFKKEQKSRKAGLTS